eukprot:gene29586-5941_t
MEGVTGRGVDSSNTSRGGADTSAAVWPGRGDEIAEEGDGEMGEAYSFASESVSCFNSVESFGRGALGVVESSTAVGRRERDHKGGPSPYSAHTQLQLSTENLGLGSEDVDTPRLSLAQLPSLKQCQGEGGGAGNGEAEQGLDGLATKDGFSAAAKAFEHEEAQQEEDGYGEDDYDDDFEDGLDVDIDMNSSEGEGLEIAEECFDIEVEEDDEGMITAEPTAHNGRLMPHSSDMEGNSAMSGAMNGGESPSKAQSRRQTGQQESRAQAASSTAMGWNQRNSQRQGEASMLTALFSKFKFKQ